MCRQLYRLHMIRVYIGGLAGPTVRHPRVGGGGVAAGQVSPPRLIPLHERRHRDLQVKEERATATRHGSKTAEPF